MKAILSLRRHSYLKTVSVFLIAVILIAGIVGCEGEAEYELTMAVNPAEGGNATDETGGSPYTEGTDVDIKAVAADCYRFVDWDAPDGTFGNATAAETTFTMPARDVTVTANFEPVPPDHFKFYGVDWDTAPYIGMDVQLVDQFGTFNATVGEAVRFGNPVEKEHPVDVVTPIADENRHYTLYQLDYDWEVDSVMRDVEVSNQFDPFDEPQQLTVWGPTALAVPTQKEGHEMVECLNHYLVYLVDETDFLEFPLVDGVNLKDQFIPDGEDVTVGGPRLFANPVQKTVVGGEVTEIQNPDEHWVLYAIWDAETSSIEKNGLQIDNQFGSQTLDLTYRDALAVPSQEISWEQPLDHFKSYAAMWPEEPPPGFPVDVQLEDQFGTINATVYDPWLFANPVSKHYDAGLPPFLNPDNHLTLYWIDYIGDPQVWEVTVNNQFGNGQVLYVIGPDFLAVPTQKGSHDPPAGLDHFLVYQVLDYDYAYPELEVYLHDQFTAQWVMVYEPYLFAIPVQKTDASGTTDIKDPDDHLVFYWIDGGTFSTEGLPIDNQFGEQTLDVEQDMEDMLGVPSQKIDWDGPYPYEF